MRIILKSGETKNYKLTLKMLGYGKGYTWHRVDYESIILGLETLYPELKGNIKKAYL